jgi:hypothetical protein
MKRNRERAIPAPIRVTNTRTKRTTVANGGKDAAHILRIELDRRTGIELATEAKS